MSRKHVVQDVCDRCPSGREKPAVKKVSLTVTYDGEPPVTWDLDLCAEHRSMFDRDMHAWGRLGQERDLEVAHAFSAASIADARRVAELRAVQSLEDRESDVQRIYTVEELVNPLNNPLEHLPADAGDWVFTDHARERMEERGVDLRAILMAACRPKIKRPGRERGLYVHLGTGAKVVVDPHNKVIVTVAIPDNQLRRAQ